MRVVFHHSALADIGAIHDYISRESPGAAKRVVERIRASTRRLESFPLSGRKGAVEGTREVVVRSLPYILVYRVTADATEVIAVFHAAQDHSRGRSD